MKFHMFYMQQANGYSLYVACGVDMVCEFLCMLHRCVMPTVRAGVPLSPQSGCDVIG